MSFCALYEYGLGCRMNIEFHFSVEEYTRSTRECFYLVILTELFDGSRHVLITSDSIHAVL